MRRTLPAFLVIWMSGCQDGHTSAPFSPSGIPTTDDGGANVAEPQPTGSVGRPDMGTRPPDAGVTDGSVGDMPAGADMATHSDLSGMMTSTDLAGADLAHNSA